MSLRDCDEEHTAKAETLESQHQCPLNTKVYLQLGAVYSLTALKGQCEQCRVFPHPHDFLTISPSQIFLLLLLMKIETNERKDFPSFPIWTFSKPPGQKNNDPGLAASDRNEVNARKHHCLVTEYLL